ncbi:MAG: SDR family oxidoreductase [Halobacteriovoraceae bacterium]|nr:SDR family oxidoreductase [Halobacteriovoraceae bacterium]MCB9093541.1 SDR family oxidoreductase [Halobacteriovoraceae bacterium]
MNFLNLEEKNILITGLNNKKSVAFHTAKLLSEAGAHLLFSVQNADQLAFSEKHFPHSPHFLCDLEKSEDILNLAKEINNLNRPLHGLLHCVAFAQFSTPYLDEVGFEEFSQAMRISCYSLAELSHALKDCFDQKASIVTVSISNKRATTYGYMGPIKAMLSSSIDYLAKSFSRFSQIRFNAVSPGPLKTSASAGIPKYIDNYLYNEKLTLRKKALETSEVANTIAFLLSERSSGINAEEIVIDSGVNVNYFDENIVEASIRNRE